MKEEEKDHVEGLLKLSMVAKRTLELQVKNALLEKQLTEIMLEVVTLKEKLLWHKWMRDR